MSGGPGSRKPPRIVAELGRPETPSEAAARKAEASRKRRANQNTLNLIIALAASLLLVLALVLITLRPQSTAAPAIDYHSVAADAQADTAVPLADPELPGGWTANSAQIRPAAGDGVLSWYIGFITPGQQFIGLTQGIGANPTWVSNQVGNGKATGETSVAGIAWTVYDHRDDPQPGNLAYAMTVTRGQSSYILFGTADDDEFRLLATALADQIGAEQR